MMLKEASIRRDEKEPGLWNCVMMVEIYEQNQMLNSKMIFKESPPPLSMVAAVPQQLPLTQPAQKEVPKPTREELKVKAGEPPTAKAPPPSYPQIHVCGFGLGN